MFVRVRVLLDVRKPLKRKKMLEKTGEEWQWVTSKYERLLTFYYFCGTLGHTKSCCETRFNTPRRQTEMLYGAWLRALSRLGSRNIEEKWLRPSLVLYSPGDLICLQSRCTRISKIYILGFLLS